MIDAGEPSMTAHAIMRAPLAFWTLAALCLVVGAVAFATFVVPRWARGLGVEGPPITSAALASAARLGAVAAWWGFAGAILRFGEQLGEIADPSAARGLGLWEGLRAAYPVDALLSTTWGRGWIAQVLGFLVCALALGRARRAHVGGGLVAGAGAWRVALLGAGALAAAPAWMGHAAADEGWPVLAHVADALHVAAAGVWAGGLALVLLAGLPALGRARRPQRTPAAYALVRAFSPVALGAVALLAGSGLVSAWRRLDPVWPDRVGDVPAALAATGSYGVTLGAKLACVAAALALGAWNWRRQTTRLRDESAVPVVRRADPGTPDAVADVVAPLDGEAARFARLGGAELAAAGLALVVTAVLIGTAPPEPADAGEAAGASAASSSLANAVTAYQGAFASCPAQRRWMSSYASPTARGVALNRLRHPGVFRRATRCG